MRLDFEFNYNKMDLWPIYNTIKEYYPIGLQKPESNNIYYTYPGIINLNNIIIENFKEGGNYENQWLRFVENIGKGLNSKVDNLLNGLIPSFTAAICIEKNQFHNGIHTKNVYFSVSLLGEYYQIFGLDSTTVFENGNHWKGYRSDNVTTVSPYSEYEEYFHYIEKEIQKHFETYRIIPYFYGQMIINGLRVPYLDEKICSINNALFNGYLNEGRSMRYIRGDQYYGSDQWEIESIDNSSINEWTILPPSQS